MQKLREYLEGSNLITKLQAKHDLLQKTLGEGQLFEIGVRVMWVIYCATYIFHEECELWIYRDYSQRGLCVII